MSDLTTIARVKSILNIKRGNYDESLALIVSGASTKAEKFCRRHFINAQYTEYHDGQGFDALLLDERPVVDSLDAVADEADVQVWDDLDWDFGDDTLLATTNYRLYPDMGKIQLVNSSRTFPTLGGGGVFQDGARNVKVVYYAGLGADIDSLPADLVLAVTLWSVAIFNRSLEGGDGMRTQALQGYLANYDTSDIPPQVRTTLALYRPHVV